MIRGQRATPLQAELESFARRARCLSAARLEHFSGVLEVLYGTDRMADACRRETAAEFVARELAVIIAGIKDPVDRRIAEALFAAQEEFHELNVTERLEYVDEHDRTFSRELYKTRRSRIIRDVAAVLRHRVNGTRVVSGDRDTDTRTACG